MKRIFSTLATAALLMSSFASMAHASALPAVGTLIKGPGDTVYYYASDGGRYVFPNSKTYFTWYPDFSTVQSIDEATLESIPLKGNVTYKPGVRLVKITTDPRTYAVDQNHTLRWVESEGVASALYGANWAQQIDDLPDAFFINYQVGAPIASTSDFTPATVTGSAGDIDHQLFPSSSLTNPTSPTSTEMTPTSTAMGPTVAFTASKTSVLAGDNVQLIAQATDAAGIAKIQIDVNGSQVNTCPSTTSCSGFYLIPVSGTLPSYTALATAWSVDNRVTTSSIQLTVSTGTSNLVMLQVAQTQITPNEAASAVVNVDPSINANQININVDGNNVKGCSNVQSCTWSNTLDGGIGTQHPVYATVTDTLGRTYTTAVQDVTISNDDTPLVTVTPAKTIIYSGETVDVTVSATDNDGISSINVLDGNGNILKTCQTSQPCTATTGPWNSLGTVTFTGSAVDTTGLSGTGNSASVTVENPYSS